MEGFSGFFETLLPDLFNLGPLPPVLGAPDFLIYIYYSKVRAVRSSGESSPFKSGLDSLLAS